jgi:hypothetical protein
MRRSHTLDSLFFFCFPSVFVPATPHQTLHRPANPNNENRHTGGKLVYRVSSPPKTFNYLLANDEPSI